MGLQRLDTAPHRLAHGQRDNWWGVPPAAGGHAECVVVGDAGGGWPHGSKHFGHYEVEVLATGAAEREH